jgi:uncharacterized protein
MPLLRVDNKAIMPAPRAGYRASTRPAGVVLWTLLHPTRQGLVGLLLAAGPALLAWNSLVVITLAEIITTLFDPTVGVFLYGITLLVLMVQAVLLWEQPIHGLFLALTFAPLIRILSVSLPLAKFPLIYWYLITSIPLFAAAFVIVKVLGFSPASLGINRKRLLLQIPIAATGLVLGFTEYQILQSQPLSAGLTLQQFWGPALILLVCTGFAEELFFRGVLQKAAIEALGGAGLLYVAILFAVLHIGYNSILDLIFVFAVGLLFGLLVKKTGSIVGVTFAHGLTNILLFLVMPFLWATGH